MNQPPPTETQTGKRIVSRGAYAKAQVKQIVLVSFSMCLLGMGNLGLIRASTTLLNRYVDPILPVTNGILFTSILLTGAGIGAFMMGAFAWNKANKIDPGVPIHRANTADLPAPDTLVRASAGPVQEQQTVLLRAATESVERHEEQLVRASAGGSSGDGA